MPSGKIKANYLFLIEAIKVMFLENLVMQMYGVPLRYLLMMVKGSSSI